MSTNVKIFRSSDAGAYNSLAGSTAGSLLGVISACLVDGYGSQTLTSLTSSGSVATATKTAHGFLTGQCLLIAGADQSEYNGEFYVTVTDADHFTYTITGSPATPATGPITAKVAPCGWTKPLTGTNIACFRQGGGNNAYLRVDDSGAQYARIVGYSTMTDANTGTNPFPTSAQVSGGLFQIRSTSNDTVVREWMLIGNDRAFHLFVNANGLATMNVMSFFGDIVSYVSGDTLYTALLAAAVTGAGYSYYTGLTTLTNATIGNYLAGGYWQIAGSINVGKHTDSVKTGGVADIGRTGSSGLPYPNPADGGLYLAPVWVHEPSQRSVRGHVPGLWASCHVGRPLGHKDEVLGAGTLNGKKFLALNCSRPNAGDDAQAIIEISNTWYA